MDSTFSGRLHHHVLPVAILWSLWLERNDKVFEDVEYFWEQIVDKIKVTAAIWVEGKEEFKGTSVEQIVSNWNLKFFDPP
ncbi:hypothetical protein BVC80_8741g6 [Macleaya cordata]|uniref:Uncharacterized protein n=1 Tax=Macleaya cordata TaxID=56857 RepID=A0A200QG03_MACCD|nr:hypothetical protein BVC80_8741g6 [Macleaya cordata]